MIAIHIYFNYMKAHSKFRCVPVRTAPQQRNDYSNGASSEFFLKGEDAAVVFVLKIAKDKAMEVASEKNEWREFQ